MKTAIYYYTGTGNSLWAARQLAAQLPDARVISMRRADPAKVDAEAVGLVFPVHIWGVPRHVVNFVSRLPAGARYYFAVADNGGQVAGTLKQLGRLLKASGLKLSAGYGLRLPSNYIPWGGAEPEDKQQRLFAAAAAKLKAAVPVIAARGEAPVEKGPLWQRLILSGIAYRFTYNKVPKMDKDFRVEDKCNGCAICTAVCPAGNILIKEGKPAWQGNCEQCMACIQWCPMEAVQYGQKTKAYARYRNPQVTLSDMQA